MKKQIALMHKYFGRAYTERCGTCCNFVRDRYHDRILQKCERYGLTHSEASDWAQSWEACGVYNTPLPDGERPLMEYADRRRPIVVDRLPGQVYFEGPEPGASLRDPCILCGTQAPCPDGCQKKREYDTRKGPEPGGEERL